MKYIRTKDGIYEVMREDNEWVIVFQSKSKFKIGVKKSKITNCADTIEELCDEFVCIGNGDFDLSGDKDIYGDLTEQMIDRYKIIYGAIWTDKGLIYVAKLNDKGEWELL